MKQIFKGLGLLSIMFIWVVNAQGASFKIRAREHFDQFKMTYGLAPAGQQTRSYSGIGPTLDFWIEEPYVYSVGLAWGMTFINNNGQTPYGKSTKDTELWSLGLEGKHYLVPKQGGLFLRWGVFSEQLKAHGAHKDVSGNSNYLGLGYEIPFETFGLALEAAQRKITLGQQIKIDAQSPSIGVHFYGSI